MSMPNPANNREVRPCYVRTQFVFFDVVSDLRPDGELVGSEKVLQADLDPRENFRTVMDDVASMS